MKKVFVAMLVVLFPLLSWAADDSKSAPKPNPKLNIDLRYQPSFSTDIQEGFEEGIMPPSKWSFHTANPPYPWSISDEYIRSGSYGACVPWAENLQVHEEVLYSPLLVPVSAFNLSFWSQGSIYWCRDEYDNCDFDVYIDEDNVWGNGNETCIYNNIESAWPDNWVWTQTNLNLSGYVTGNPLYIAFVYTGLDDADVGLDDIEISYEEKVWWEAAYDSLFDSPSDLGLLRQYRDEFLTKTAKGELYTRLLYKRSEKALQVLLANPKLMMEANYLIDTNKDAVTQVLNGNEGVIYNTDEIVSFLKAYARKSPPGLKLLANVVKRGMLIKQMQGKPFLGFTLE